MTFFSVIIPLYNKASYIENTLKSVLDQTYTDYEIIIVNDGSTDGGDKIISKFTDARIHLFHQKNKGVSAARNLGIEKSTGELIAFLDADDFWYPNHLEELARLHFDFPNCGIYCSRYYLKTTDNHMQIPYFDGVNSSFRGIIKDYFLSNRPFRITWTSSLAIPKVILDHMGGFSIDVTNGQDLELWTKIGIEHPVALSSKTTAIYNFHLPDSLAKNNFSTMKLMDFEQFKIAEEQNPSLKKFLDLYRIEYGVRYTVFGDRNKSRFYLKNVDKKNISLKIRVLLKLPSFVLLLIYRFNQVLKRKGLTLSVYE
jgi:glycosyltransferase involved in cell wall biosynthesis